MGQSDLDRVRYFLVENLAGDPPLGRGRTISEEQTAVGMAVRTMKRAGIQYKDVAHMWPKWYTSEGELMENHEAIRVEECRKREAKKSNGGGQHRTNGRYGSAFGGIDTEFGWFSSFQEYAEFLNKMAYEARARANANRANGHSQQDRARQEQARQQEQAKRDREQKQAHEQAKRDRTRAQGWWSRFKVEPLHYTRPELLTEKAYMRAWGHVQVASGKIGYRANILLMETMANGMGRSHGEVLRILTEEFPLNKPTESTVDWYDSKLRKVFGKSAVPRRPRF
jgi:hypothetical protein